MSLSCALPGWFSLRSARERLADTVEGRIEQIRDPRELDGMLEQLQYEGRLTASLKSKIELRRIALRNGD